MALVPTVGAIIVSIGLPTWIDAAARQSFEMRVQAEAEMLAESIAPALEFEDHQFVEHALQRLQADPEAISAIAMDANGQLMARWERPDLAPMPEDEYHVAVRTKIAAPSAPGSLVIHVDADTLRRSHHATMWAAWGAGITLFGVGILFSLLLGHLLGRRLSLLAFAADRIAKGDIGEAREMLASDAQRGQEGSRDEVSQLASRLDAMAQELAAHHAAQADVQRTLEDKIEQRTADLRQSLSAAQQASAAKGAFLATMSHELRTPMNGVLGAAQLLGGLDLDDEDQELLEVLIRSSDTLLGLLDQVLDVSKIEAGRMYLEVVDFDLAEVMRETIAMFAQTAKDKDLRLDLEMPTGAWTRLRGDAHRIRQVLVNLIGNAFKFTEQGSVVVRCQPLKTSAGRRVVRIEVADTGVGIPKSAQDHIFDTFTQADSSTTREYGGSGLGLAICRQLIEDLMGGRMAVDSEVGVGSHFWFEVGLEALDVPAEATPLSIVPSERRLRVLVAEDNAVNRLVVGKMLTRLGHDVFEVAHGRAAVDRVARGDIDVVLMDCQMPVMDGYDATRAIRAAENGGPRVPIVALTANAFEADRDRCMAAGMDDFLGKPLRFERLAEVVSSLGQDLDRLAS